MKKLLFVARMSLGPILWWVAWCGIVGPLAAPANSAPLAAEDLQPTVVVQPSSAAQGELVRFLASHFSHNALLTIQFNGNRVSGASDYYSGGVFVKEYRIPSSLADGRYTVNVADGYGLTAQAEIAIRGASKQPTLTLGKRQEFAGGTINLSGEGWDKKAPFEAALRNKNGSHSLRLITNACVQRIGDKSFGNCAEDEIVQIWEIPGDVPPGEYQFALGNSSAWVSAPFTVLRGASVEPGVKPRIALNPTQGEAGTTVVISGAGFPKNERRTVLIRFDGKMLPFPRGAFQINDDGDLTGAVVDVPIDAAPGMHTFSVEDGSGNLATATFLVKSRSNKVEPKPRPEPFEPKPEPEPVIEPLLPEPQPPTIEPKPQPEPLIEQKPEPAIEPAPLPAPSPEPLVCDPRIPSYSQPGCQEARPEPLACDPGVPSYSQPGCRAVDGNKPDPADSAKPEPQPESTLSCDPEIPTYSQPGCRKRD